MTDKADKSFAKFCNDLRCPLCGSQLDGTINKWKADLYCVGNNQEYRVTYTPGKTIPEDEIFWFWYTQYEYAVRFVSWQNGQDLTTVTRYNSDMVGYHKTNSAKIVFKYKGRLPLFQKRMDEDVFLEKLQTYQLFY